MIFDIFSAFEKIFSYISKVKVVLLFISMAYLIYLTDTAGNLIKNSTLNVYYSEVITLANQLSWLAHLVGVLSIILLGLSIYIPNKELTHFIYDLISKRKLLDNSDLEQTLYSAEQSGKKLMEFSKDADEIYLLIGHGDFIKPDNPQFNELKKFRNNAHILMNKDHRVNLPTLRELTNNGVQIKTYTHYNPHLRGRLKISPAGKSACFFDKKGNMYKMLEMTNAELVEMMFAKYQEWFTTGRNPYIKHMLFDLGNVFLDGDFNKFLEAVEKITSSKIDVSSDNYLCASEDMNLGKTDIKGYVEASIGRKLTVQEAHKIKKLWTSTYTINQNLDLLAHQLKRSGYIISLISNGDRENADTYDLKNYLDVFEHRFFSFEMKLLKPDEAYYYAVLKSLNAQPYECVVIDDHKGNIDVARKLGFESIYVSRAITIENRANYVSKELKEMGVLVEQTQPNKV